MGRRAADRRAWGGTGHLLQIESPQACVAVTMYFLADCGLA
jgi:hypothetical protein